MSKADSPSSLNTILKLSASQQPSPTDILTICMYTTSFSEGGSPLRYSREWNRSWYRAVSTASSPKQASLPERSLSKPDFECAAQNVAVKGVLLLNYRMEKLLV
jgi:hypothetical protein